MKQLVVIGPTASGKSELSDSIGDHLDDLGLSQRTILFDSMQVYREIPEMTNQHRRRHAELLGVASVFSRWSVADHCACAASIRSRLPEDTALLLEGGTGMYITAYLLGTDLARRVPDDIRRKAEQNVLGRHSTPNPRRAVREEELRLSGADGRGSIWDGRIENESAIIYLRPERYNLDESIRKRSLRITDSGLGEVESLISSESPPEDPDRRIQPTVRDSIGFRELSGLYEGGMTKEVAAERIATRTRQLSRRQMRWFDKMISVLDRDPNLKSVTILDRTDTNTMHRLDDTIARWTD